MSAFYLAKINNIAGEALSAFYLAKINNIAGEALTKTNQC
jgi:hypothetical protein